MPIHLTPGTDSTALDRLGTIAARLDLDLLTAGRVAQAVIYIGWRPAGDSNG